MSELTLKYNTIILYCESGQAASIDFRKGLDNNDIAYSIMDYKAEFVADALEPINTWTFVDIDGESSFSKMPLLIFHDVLWEAPDATDQYYKDRHAVSFDTVPKDFTTKADKVK